MERDDDPLLADIQRHTVTIAKKNEPFKTSYLKPIKANDIGQIHEQNSEIAERYEPAQFFEDRSGLIRPVVLSITDTFDGHEPLSASFDIPGYGTPGQFVGDMIFVSTGTSLAVRPA
jgi:hypothetical protein